MWEINNPVLNGVRQEQCGPHARGSIEISQHKKKGKCIVPEQVAMSINMFIGEELILEANLSLCLFI